MRASPSAVRGLDGRPPPRAQSGSTSSRRRRQSGRARQRVARERVAVKEGAGARSSLRNVSNSSAVATVTPSGMNPPVTPLLRQTRSGATPARSQANSGPVRPNPVATSSAMSGMPAARRALADAAQHVLAVHPHSAGRRAAAAPRSRPPAPRRASRSAGPARRACRPPRGREGARPRTGARRTPRVKRLGALALMAPKVSPW